LFPLPPFSSALPSVNVLFISPSAGGMEEKAAGDANLLLGEPDVGKTKKLPSFLTLSSDVVKGKRW